MRKTTKKIIFYIVLAILVGVFAYSAYRLGSYILESVLTKGDYSDLSDMHGGRSEEHT